MASSADLRARRRLRDGHIRTSHDTFLADLIGEPFISAYETLKRDEIARYHEEEADPATRLVTRWEIEEYLQDY
jgi:glutamine synthetase